MEMAARKSRTTMTVSATYSLLRGCLTSSECTHRTPENPTSHLKVRDAELKTSPWGYTSAIHKACYTAGLLFPQGQVIWTDVTEAHVVLEMVANSSSKWGISLKRPRWSLCCRLDQRRDIAALSEVWISHYCKHRWRGKHIRMSVPSSSCVAD